MKQKMNLGLIKDKQRIAIIGNEGAHEITKIVFHVLNKVGKLYDFILSPNDYQIGDKHNLETIDILNNKIDLSYGDLLDESSLESKIRKIKHETTRNDENNENIIYEDARFELFGFPIFYVPIASHPSDKVKKRSGFLAPTFGSSGDLGAIVKVPYLFNFAPHYDLTITPWIVTKGAAIFEGEWRQRFKRGKINFWMKTS